MKTILDLPLEILDSVSGLLLPHSLAPFVLSCKTIYIRSRGIIDRHKANISRWGSIKLSGPYRGDVLHLLYAISREPLMAEYVQRIDLWDRREYWEILEARERLGPEWDIGKEEQKMDEIKLMVQSSPFIPDDMLPSEQRWDLIERETMIPDGKYSSRACPMTVITLLMFLPGLKELGLPCWWGPEHEGQLVADYEIIYQTLVYLVASASKPLVLGEETVDTQSLKRPLARLETIVPFRPSGRDTYFDAKALCPFLTLPNLKEVYASSILNYGHIPGMDFSNTTLRRLEIAYSTCAPAGIASILRPLCKLEVFKFSFQIKGWPDNLSTGEFLDSVAGAVGHTLRELVLRDESRWENFEDPPSSFQAFTKLEVLDIDMDWILRDTVNDVDPDHFCLAAALPSTIKKILFNAEHDLLQRSTFRKMFAGFKEEWESRLVNLENAVVRVQELESWEYGEEEEQEQDSEGEREDDNEDDDGATDVRSQMIACQKAVEKENVKWKVFSVSRFRNMGWAREFSSRFNCEEDLFADPE